jgi:hypothetical protein
MVLVVAPMMAVMTVMTVMTVMARPADTTTPPRRCQAPT